MEQTLLDEWQNENNTMYYMRDMTALLWFACPMLILIDVVY